VIRRGFWLAAGAVLGVAGYRKATRLARTITTAPGVPRVLTQAPGRALAPGSAQARPAVPMTDRVRAAASFARDVRDGMAEYRELHPRQLGRRLGNRNAEQPGASPGGIEP
jgi:hypothetical protein